MARFAAILVLAIGVLAQGPALAGDLRDHGREFEAMAKESAEKFRRAVEDMIRRIPRYGAPKVTPEGDIVVPRRGERPRTTRPLPDDQAET